MAHELFDEMAPFVKMLDSANSGTRYASTMAKLRQRIDDPDLTPSAQVLAAAREHGGCLKYVQFASQQHKQTLLAQPLKGAMLERFTTSVKDSLSLQRRLEARDESSLRTT